MSRPLRCDFWASPEAWGALRNAQSLALAWALARAGGCAQPELRAMREHLRFSARLAVRHARANASARRRALVRAAQEVAA